MARFANGVFIPKNAAKYIGKHPIQYRSSWELSLMNVLDSAPEVLGWASETFSIPYLNPLTQKWSMYIPDFLVAYVDKNTVQHCEMIEIKPAKEAPEYVGKVSKQTKLVQAVNAAKWHAARIYCAKRKWNFRVLTEVEMFSFKRKK